MKPAQNFLFAKQPRYSFTNDRTQRRSHFWNQQLGSWFGSRLCFVGLLVLSFTTGLRSQNLVPNGNFESFTYTGNPSCTNTWNTYTTGFGNVCPASRLHCTLANWYEPGGGSTDLLTRCGCAATGTGIYRCEGQNPLCNTPLDSEAAVWLRFYNDQFPDYLAVQLSAPLKSNRTYEISCRVRLCGNNRYAHNAFGFYLTETPYTWGFWAAPNYAAITPQFPTNPFLIDNTGQWVTLTELYTVPANSPDLHYLQIGPWKNYTNSRVQINPSGLNQADWVIDDVSIIENIPLSAPQAAWQVERTQIDQVMLRWDAQAWFQAYPQVEHWTLWAGSIPATPGEWYPVGAQQLHTLQITAGAVSTPNAAMQLRIPPGSQFLWWLPTNKVSGFVPPAKAIPDFNPHKCQLIPVAASEPNPSTQQYRLLGLGEGHRDSAPICTSIDILGRSQGLLVEWDLVESAWVLSIPHTLAQNWHVLRCWDREGNSLTQTQLPKP